MERCKLFGSDYHNGTVQPKLTSLAFEGTEPIGGTIVIDVTSIAILTLQETLIVKRNLKVT